MDAFDLPAAGRVAGFFRRRESYGVPRRGGGLVGRLPFLLVVLLPTVLAAIYYFGIASPQYVSEATFVVRGQSNAPTGMLSSLLLSGGGGSASEDTYAVQDYMMSRDAAADLIKTQRLRSVFNPPGADSLSRFPGLLHNSDFEHFFEYYQAHVLAELDSTTSISTLRVRTFDPADSQRIAKALLVASEQLINRMNERQRANLISTAAKEVSAAEVHLRALAAEIADYRNREALLDPTKQSVPMLKTISDLESVLTSTRVQVAQLQRSTPNSPLIPVYLRRIAALQTAIAQSSSGITGSSQSLVPKITAYDDLTLQQQFGEKELANAITSLEAAKTQADRQQLYLEEITQPNLPDYAAYPKSLASVAVVFASLLGLFLMAKLIINGVREHQIV